MTDSTDIEIKKSCTADYHREYYLKNRERIIERTKAYAKRRREENHAHVRELERKKVAAWREANPEKAKALEKRGRDAARKRASDYIASVKEGVPCADCGTVFPPVCMDFDHIGDDKYKSVASMVGAGHSIETIQKEIDKCELVCANCHRLRTHNRRQESRGKTNNGEHD